MIRASIANGTWRSAGLNFPSCAEPNGDKMLRIDGRREPGLLTRLRYRMHRLARGARPLVVEVQGDGPACCFACASQREYKRALNLYLKEPGTIAWLQRELRPGDAFLDIGANMGIFTIFAARILRGAGSVTAVEPHVASASRLLENVQINGLQQTVAVLTCALADARGFSDFHYRDRRPASSNSQLARPRDSTGRGFEAAAVELKAVSTVDGLVAQRVIPSPDVVKIDVDGREPDIIRGMQAVLTSDSRPRALQVEVGPQSLSEIEARLAAWGYQRLAQHYSKGGQRRLAGGEARDGVPHNVIFGPVP